MVAVSFFQDSSLSGTGATELANSSADSSTLIDEGDTIAFSGSKSTLDVNDSAFVDDAGTTGFVNSSGSINGVTVTSSTKVEYNYNLLAEDPTTGLYHRIDVFAFGDDGNKGYLVSRAWDPDTGDFADPVVPYTGGTLTILDGGSIDSQGRSIDTNDADLEAFMRDTALSLVPYNNDAAGGVMGDIVVCFCGGTLIETATHAKPVEELSPGDLVKTMDHGLQPVRWVYLRNVTADNIIAKPQLAPVIIRAGALGAGTPTRDLWVSQQHRVLLRNKFAKAMFGCEEILVAAKHILPLDGVEIMSEPKNLTYVHFLFDQHELVYSDGAITESLYVGPQTIKSLPNPALDELCELFPEIKTMVNTGESPISARPLAAGKKGKELVSKLKANGPATTMHPPLETEPFG